ncbi:MAG: hypothetical protein AAF658_14110, partial [Myxococcota bacterium]
KMLAPDHPGRKPPDVVNSYLEHRYPGSGTDGEDASERHNAERILTTLDGVRDVFSYSGRYSLDVLKEFIEPVCVGAFELPPLGLASVPDVLIDFFVWASESGAIAPKSANAMRKHTEKKRYRFER